MACIFYNMPYVFFCMVRERKKTGFRGWKNKNKTDRNAIGFYVHLKGTMLCSLMNFTEKCNVLKISNYRFLFFS